MAIYETLQISRLDEDHRLTLTTEMPELVHLSDPAKAVLIDFRKIQPTRISSTTSIDEALRSIKLQALPMLLVTQRDQIIGLLTKDTLLSEKPIRLMRERGLSRAELTVGMLMTPQQDLMAIESNQLRHAKVGHIINTLKEQRSEYLLVVSRLKKNQQIIKGLFSVTQISKQLHVDLGSLQTKLPETIVELRQKF